MTFTPAEKRICDRVASGLFIHGTCPNAEEALHFAHRFVILRRDALLETARVGDKTLGTLPMVWACNCAVHTTKSQGEWYCEGCHTRSPYLSPGEGAPR